METSLHRSLKQLYGGHGSQTEAVVRGYRADVLQHGLVVEIQASPLSAIRHKIADLVRHGRVLVVKPITQCKLIRWGDPRKDDWGKPRRSPKRGRLVDVFDELVHFTKVFPHPNLTIDVVLIEDEELRVRRRRQRRFGPNYRLHDRRLLGVLATHRLETPADLVRLTPADLPATFTTVELAHGLDCPAWLARKVAYTLRHCGATRATGKIGNRIVYECIVSRNATAAMMVAC
jgi:hypothetical protein